MLVSQRVVFKKVVIIHGKDGFYKIKRSLFNIPNKTEGIKCNVFPRGADNNGLVLVKLNIDLKYRGYFYYQPIKPSVVYNALRFCH